MQRIPQQLIPLAVLSIVLLAALVVARQLFVPDTFGQHGHYRAASVDDNAAQPLVYAGYQVCADCHDDIATAKQESSHAGLSCETCHGPATAHASAPDESLPNIPRAREHCELCHSYDPARPQGFPQILTTMHNPGQACIECHDSHSPRLAVAADECSACHRAIASQKAVSNHARLSCTDCHAVPVEHVNQPRLARATKPTSKDTCGRCHARNSDAPVQVARIDIAEHGGRYLCWDCHYPHFPEAKL